MTIEHGDVMFLTGKFNILVKTGAEGDVMLWSTECHNLVSPFKGIANDLIYKIGFMDDCEDHRKYHADLVGKLCEFCYKLKKEEHSTGMELKHVAPIPGTATIRNRWKPVLTYIPHNYHKIIEQGKQDYKYMMIGQNRNEEDDRRRRSARYAVVV